MSAPDCVILGGGGHARVVIDCLRVSGLGNPRIILDVDSQRWNTELDDVSITGGDAMLSELKQKGISHFVLGVGGAGDNRPRHRLFDLALSFRLQPLILIHPRAIVSGHASIGAGVQVFAGAIVNVGATLGANVIVNTGAIVEHDCVVGAHAHVATGACLGGSVRVGEGAHIGAGSVIRQGIDIGHHTLVGAGAIVVRNLPPGVMAVGVSAKPSPLS